jgi:hypothetical protein
VLQLGERRPAGSALLQLVPDSFPLGPRPNPTMNDPAKIVMTDLNMTKL